MRYLTNSGKVIKDDFVNTENGGMVSGTAFLSLLLCAPALSLLGTTKTDLKF